MQFLAVESEEAKRKVSFAGKGKDTSFRKLKAKALLQSLESNVDLPGALLIVAGALFFFLVFKFYTWWLIPLLLLVIGIISYKSKPLGVIFSALLAFPGIIFQSPVLGWLYLLVLTLILIEAWTYWYIIAILEVLVLAPFAPPPLNFLGGIVIPLITLSALILGSRRSLFMVVPCVFIILLLSSLWGIQNGAFMPLKAEGYQADEVKFLFNNHDFVEPLQLKDEGVKAFSSMWSGENIKNLSFAIGISFNHIITMLLGDSGLIQIIYWGIAVFLVGYIPGAIKHKYEQAIASLSLWILPIGYFASTVISAVSFDPLILFFVFLANATVATMEHFKIYVAGESRFISSEKAKKFGKFGIQDLSTSAGGETLESIGGYDSVKKELNETIVWPLKQKELSVAYGIRPPHGVLLFGPPGTGKTMLMRALSHELGMGFYYVKCSELLSQWYGESLPYTEKLLIKDSDGKIKLREIGKIVEEKQNVRVLSFDSTGNAVFSEVKDWIKHRCTSKICEVRTRTGRKIRVTDYHSLFALNETKIESVPTSKLVPGVSYIAIPSKTAFSPEPIGQIDFLEALKEDDHGLRIKNASKYLEQAITKLGKEKVAELLGYKKEYLDHVVRRKVGVRVKPFLNVMKEASIAYDNREILIGRGSKFLPGIMPLDERLSAFIGLWVAEGSYNRKNVVRISTSQSEVEKISQICRELFGKITVYEKKGTLGRDVYVCSRPLYVLFRHVLGLEDGAGNKKFPEIAFSLSRNNLSALLRGYFSWDGSVYENQKGVAMVEAITASRELANQILYLLLYFGIVGTVYDRQEWNGTKSYRVYLTGGKSLTKFKDIGFLDERRENRLDKALGNVSWFRSEQVPINGSLKAIIENRLPKWKNSATISKNILGSVDVGEELEFLEFVENDVYLDRVEEVKQVEDEEYVYDVSVDPCQNFVAGFGGIFAHNSERNLTELFQIARKQAPCITGDTLITLEDGKEFTVKELFEKKLVGAKVWSMDDKFQVVPKRILAMQRKPPEQIVRVTTSRGEIRCTPDHLFPVLQDGELAWLPAGQIKGKHVATPRILHVPDRSFSPLEFLPEETELAGLTVEWVGDQIRKTGITRAEQKLQLTPGLLQTRLSRARRGLSDLFLSIKLLEKLGVPREAITADKAVLLAKGWGCSVSTPINLPREIDEEIMYLCGLLWSDGSHNRRTWKFCGDDHHLHKRVKEIVETKFGVNVSTYDYDLNCRTTAFSSVVLVRLLGSIQARVLEMPERLLAPWLRGVFDGDGHIVPDGSRVSVGVTKKGNRAILQKALLRVGIPTTNTKSVSIEFTSLSQVSTYLAKIGFEHPLKKSRAANFAPPARRDSKSRFDVVPVGKLMRKARESAGLPTQNMNFSHSVIYGWENYDALPSRERLAETHGFLSQHSISEPVQQLQLLANSQVFWAKVEEVEFLKEKEEVYDLQIEGTQNFMANDLFVHNCILFFDEIDSIGKKRESYSADDVAPRLMSLFLQELDGFKDQKNVIVIGATNIPNMLDHALMRPGRFDKIIYMSLPDKASRQQIFKVHTKKLPLSDDVDVVKLAEITERYSGADLANVCVEAARLAAEEAVAAKKVVPVRMAYFRRVLDAIRPSVSLEKLEEYDQFKMDFERRVGEPKKEEKEDAVSWKDVVGLDDVRRAMIEAIEIPLLHEDLIKQYKIKPSKGLLLFGPPGCGKTLIVKAAANEMKASFLTISGASLLKKGYEGAVGVIKETFNRARERAPCLIFIDEIEAIAPSRDLYQSKVVEDIVTQMLTELDGVKELKNVMLIGATNKPNMIDSALMRPGRFDKIVFIPPPSPEARKAIFQLNMEGIPLETDVNFDDIAKLTEGFTGADISSVCQEAKMTLVRKRIHAKEEAEPKLDHKTLLSIVSKRRPSITVEQLKEYLAFLKQYGERK